MPKEEWGVKRVCPTTGKRFFDLNRNPIVSPYTGEVVTLDTGKGSRTLVADRPDPSAKAKKPAEEETASDEEGDIDLGDDVLEDDEDESDAVPLDDLTDVAADDDDS